MMTEESLDRLQQLASTMEKTRTQLLEFILMNIDEDDVRSLGEEETPNSLIYSYDCKKCGNSYNFTAPYKGIFICDDCKAAENQ